MADYKVTDTELIDIADAIRTKGETGDLLEFPNGFINAINDLPGGGIEWMTPYAFDLKRGFINGPTFYYNPNDTSYVDVYLLEPTQSFIVITLDQVVGNRFRILICNSDPTTTITDIQGWNLGDLTPSQYGCIISNYNIINSDKMRYLIIAKTNQTVPNIKTHVIQIPL